MAPPSVSTVLHGHSPDTSGTGQSLYRTVHRITFEHKEGNRLTYNCEGGSKQGRGHGKGTSPRTDHAQRQRKRQQQVYEHKVSFLLLGFERRLLYPVRRDATRRGHGPPEAAPLSSPAVPVASGLVSTSQKLLRNYTGKK